MHKIVRDWSLIMGRGGGAYKTGGGGASEVLSLRNGRGSKTSFSHCAGGGGGHNKFFVSFNTGAFGFSHALDGAKFPPSRRVVA